MKNFFTASVAAFAVTALTAAAANAASTTGSASATVVPALTISQAQSLSFGSFASVTGGTITHTGATTGDVAYLSGAQVGQFNINGQPNASVNFTTDPTATLTGPGAPMLATLIPGGPAGTLDGSGFTVFNVGGSLAVAAGQTAGVYTGTYNASVNY